MSPAKSKQEGGEELPCYGSLPTYRLCTSVTLSRTPKKDPRVDALSWKCWSLSQTLFCCTWLRRRDRPGNAMLQLAVPKTTYIHVGTLPNVYPAGAIPDPDSIAPGSSTLALELSLLGRSLLLPRSARVGCNRVIHV